MRQLFNVDVYWPEEVALLVDYVVRRGAHYCTYSNHAKREAEHDRYGRVSLPAYLDLRDMTPIEAEVTNGKLTKFLVRASIGRDHDLVLVLVPQGHQKLFCRTVWINRTDDKHKTLDKSKYVQAKVTA
jgi:hypothetical protein